MPRRSARSMRKGKSSGSARPKTPRKGRKPRASALDIYATLKEAILSFELYPGARFTETELAERFGVSRTPIREALQRLETEHYLSIRPKQGCFVRELDITDLTQRYQVRIELEMLALQLACVQMPDRSLQQLAEEWDPGIHRDHSVEPNVMELKEESFHLALAAGGGNDALYKYIDDINNHIRIVRRLDFTSPERVTRTYEEHYAIIQHLLQRDLKSAQRLMRAHIMRSMEFAKTLTLMELARKRPSRSIAR
ncbi:MAG: GntR family transcriptional regulator [Acidiferrobacterales bacterium]